ncbi:DUF6161 domain-containing protein [Flavobacterium sp.]|jgi:hypothetical protein|uniref:DUF6161 domain-containing protein n=1 Tax=Flavobacterium sp. TaxID=239 RepID=UPI0037C02C52
MTNSEFNKKILEANDIDWFKNVEETFNFPYINVSIKQKGISAIYKFLNQQIEGWDKTENLPTEFENSKNYFLRLKQQILDFVNSYIQSEESTLQGNWRTIINSINNVGSFPFVFNCPETEFLLKINTETPQYFSAAYNFITNGNSLNSNGRDNLIGYILAYEFKQKDKSDLTERRNAEKLSLSKIRSEFHKYLSESEQELITHLKNTNEDFEEHIKQIDELKIGKEELISKWFDETKSVYEKLIYDSNVTIKDLESTYKEKLKLEEPAIYWSDRAKTLRNQGWWALGVMIALIFIAAWSLSEILWKAPEQIYSSWFGDDKSAAIRWSIVYITLLSLIAFCIKAVSKVMFSSFHLARDCEERHTLTYFYLALLKDSNVTDSDRQLIMQSLFSRAETGLLKDDSSPAMPSDITKFMQR